MTSRAPTFQPLTFLTTLALLPACGGEEQQPTNEATTAPTIGGPMAPGTAGAGASAPAGGTGGPVGPATGGAGAGNSAGPAGAAGGTAGMGVGGMGGGTAGMGVGGMGGAAGGTVGMGVGGTAGTAGGTAGMGVGGTAGMGGGTAGMGAGGMAGVGGGAESEEVGGAGGAGGEDPNGPSSLPPTDDYSDYGPFETTNESGTGPGGTYTVVRPETLGEDGFLHAPITFGPGIGGAPSTMMNLLERIASHGFVIVSTQLDQGPRNPENNQRMTDGLDWLIEQNTTAGSMFEGKLDVTRAVSMGYSVGGTAAVDIGGYDPIVTAVAIHGHGAEPLEDASGTTFLLMGGTNDVSNGESWMVPTFEALEQQTFFSLVEGAEHRYPGDSVNGVQAGVEAPAAIAWIRYWIYNDQEAAKYFEGDDCVMCMSPWTNTQRKNWP